MGQGLHGSATTTEAVRRAIQHSRESLRALAKRYGVNPKTVAKGKARTSVSDLPGDPSSPDRSTVLSVEEEAVVAFRRHILSPLDDCLYALQPTVAHLTRSSSASLPAAPRDLPVAAGRRRSLRQAQIQALSDRLFSYRHRRSSYRAGQTLPACRRRSDVKVRLLGLLVENRAGEDPAIATRLHDPARQPGKLISEIIRIAGANDPL
jgi:hypothetical protein